jgi:hypothetical protein
MRQLFLAAVLGLALAGSAAAETTACTASEDGLRAALEERYAAMRIAMHARDAEAISALLAPGFVSEDVAGEEADAAAMIEAVLALPVTYRETRSTTLLSVRLAAPGAIVEQRFEMEKVKKILAGMETRLQTISVSTDEWVCSEGAWLIQRTTTDQLDLILDGVRVHKVHPRKEA